MLPARLNNMTLQPHDIQARRFSVMSAGDQALHQCRKNIPYLAQKYRSQFDRFSDIQGSVLDVGCGEGIRRDYFKGRRYVGIDLAWSRVDFAAQTQAGGLFAGGNACQLPFRDAAFDLVFCYGLLHHLDHCQMEYAVREMFRVCKPGGRISWMEPNVLSWPNFFLALLSPAERGILHSSKRVYLEILRQQIPPEAYSLEIHYDNLPFPIFQVLVLIRKFRGIYEEKFTSFCHGFDAAVKKIAWKPFWQLIMLDFQKKGTRSE